MKGKIYNSIYLMEGFFTKEETINYFGEKIANECIFNPNADHMLFNRYVTSLMDESIFNPLYKTTNGPGKPAVSPKVLAACMCYCESFGVSPVHVIKAMKTDVCMRMAIGIFNVGNVFCLRTFNGFKNRLRIYKKETGIDLYEKCVNSVIARQIKMFGVDASRVRMDSTMLNSNIQIMSRYQIVLSTLQVVLKKNPFKFSEELQSDVDEHLKENGKHTMYALKDGKMTYTEILTNLGVFVHKVLKEIDEYEELNGLKSEGSNSKYALLRRVFGEQFNIVEGKVVPISGKKISGKSIQNPYDPEATYVDKNEGCHGYKVNVVETFGNISAPNLVTAYQVVTVSVGDNQLYQEGITKSEANTQQKIDVAATDHGYVSDSNTEFNLKHFAKEKGQSSDDTPKVLEQWVGKMGGRAPQYELFEENDVLKVVDRTTGKEYRGNRVNDIVKRDGRKTHVKRWMAVVEDKNGKPVEKEFSMVDLENSIHRREIENTPKERLSVRNNVEATMFQMVCTTDGSQTKYRGLYQHTLFCGARVLWINFRRIALFLKKKARLEKLEARAKAS